MTLSAVAAILLPARLVGLEGLVFEPVAWFGGSVADSTAAVRDAVGPTLRPAVPARRVERLEADLERLRRLVGQQALLLEQRERELRELTGLKESLGDLPVRLLPAYVLGGDASPLRQTLRIGRGAAGEYPVRIGDWVAAATAVDRLDDGLTGRQRLLSQWLIGRVIEVGPLTSRVQLSTDPAFGPVPVRAGRVDASGGYVTTNPVVLLEGRGGAMRIREAPANFLEQGFELVLTEPTGRLPLRMLIGRIVSAEPLPQSPLHYNLSVEPLADPHRLRRVYVIWLPADR